MRRWLVGLLVIACAVGLLWQVGTPAARGAAAGPRFLTDDQGRALILYGLDADDSGPLASAQAATAQYGLLGGDFTRILLSWKRVEPTPWHYDDAYLESVAQQVAWYGDAGEHVLLALSQDAYGPPPGTPAAPAPATAARIRAADAFWRTSDADPSAQDRYVATWTHIAQWFAQHPGSGKPLGFDLLDRPWGGSLQGPQFETGPLAALYRRLIEAVRVVDRTHWLFVEPEADSADWGMPSTLPYLADPRPGPARIGYAPQLYPALLDPDGQYTGGRTFPIDRALASWEIQVRRTAKRLDAPVLVGGWGLDLGSQGAHLYLDHVQAMIDRLGAGAAFWRATPGSWSPWTKPGKPADIADVLETAYPRAVAGVPVEYDYDKGTFVFTLQFRDAAGVSGGTEIYLPPSDFPQGPQVDFDAEFTSVWDPVRHVLTLTVDRPVPGLLHTLRLTPATSLSSIG